jgi:pimeloyl-ACP methyl ester carboxylesterase
LYVPPKSDLAATRHLLVLPNNTGKGDDDLAIHEANVKRKIAQVPLAFGKLNVPAIMPVFPRPGTDWKIYTHALDRDALTTEKKEFSRFDLQLVAMIDDARRRLGDEKIVTDSRVLIYGFSAAGMFSNRFAFLHPERVLAAAVGSPGGWPLAPSTEFNGKKLRYPIGIHDLETVSGKKFEIERLRKVRLFIFLGDKDDNDSVIFGDSYEPEDKELVIAAFGKLPVDRWESSKKFYADARLDAEFKLYPGIDHTMTLPIIADVNQFFETAMTRAPGKP